MAAERFIALVVVGPQTWGWGHRPASRQPPTVVDGPYEPDRAHPAGVSAVPLAHARSGPGVGTPGERVEGALCKGNSARS